MSNKIIKACILILIIVSIPEIHHSQCELEPSQNLQTEIIARSSSREMDEPFIRGEEILMRITYDAFQDSTNRVVHGVIPTFGNGWEVDSINVDFFTPRLAYLDNISEWIESSDSCGAFLRKDVPALCTYTDEDGQLKLCNLFCEECPCSEGMVKGDKLPSGWFWNFTPASFGCEYSPCELASSWGVWGPYANIINYPFFLDIVLKVKNFESIDSCLGSNDLDINIQEVWDDITGCFQYDGNTVRNNYKIFSRELDCLSEPDSSSYNGLKITFFHDENKNHELDEDENVFKTNIPVEVIGEHISGYSELLDYYVMTGNQYTVICDSIINYDTYQLFTNPIQTVNFSDSKFEEVFFGLTDVPLNISDLEKPAVFAYPSPVQQVLHLSQNISNLKIYDSIGTLIFQQRKLIGSINVAGWSSGVYIFSSDQGKGKFIVE